MTYRIVADFQNYSVIEPCNIDTYNCIKARQRKRRREKADREATISAIVGGALTLVFIIGMIAWWLVFGY